MKRWYIDSLKEKYSKLQKQYKISYKKEQEKIIRTMNTINSCLANTRTYGSIDIMLESDYKFLLANPFWFNIVNNITAINNDYIPKILCDDSIYFSNEEIIELTNEFFKYGTNKEIYEIFTKILNKNIDRIKILENVKDQNYGETFYLEYFNEIYIQVIKHNRFGDLTTAIHEFGHAIHFMINYSDNFYNNLVTFSEIVSTFFELISFEYFKNSKYKISSIYGSYYMLNNILKSSKDLNCEIKLLSSFDKPNTVIELRKNIDILLNDLSIEKQNNIFNNNPCDNFIYITAISIASNLFMIYLKDPEYAFYLLNKIINIDTNITKEEYFNKIKNLGLIIPDGMINYDEHIKRRIKKLN